MTEKGTDTETLWLLLKGAALLAFALLAFVSGQVYFTVGENRDALIRIGGDIALVRQAVDSQSLVFRDEVKEHHEKFGQIDVRLSGIESRVLLLDERIKIGVGR